MVGRAGRPGYDDTGVAVIMTSKEHQERYENLSKGQEIVESQLPQRFLEGKSQYQKASRGKQLRDCRRLALCLMSHLLAALNSEVSSGVIVDIESALLWLKSTYFYVCIRKRPQ